MVMLLRRGVDMFGWCRDVGHCLKEGSQFVEIEHLYIMNGGYRSLENIIIKFHIITNRPISDIYCSSDLAN